MSKCIVCGGEIGKYFNDEVQKKYYGNPKTSIKGRVVCSPSCAVKCRKKKKTLYELGYFDISEFENSHIWNRTKHTVTVYEESWLRNPVVVYGILHEQTNLIKVGVTNNIKSRISSLIGSSPVKLKLKFLFESETGKYQDACDYEKHLHRMLSEYRRHGEWFEYNDQVKKFLIGLTNGNGNGKQI